MQIICKKKRPIKKVVHNFLWMARERTDSRRIHSRSSFVRGIQNAHELHLTLKVSIRRYIHAIAGLSNILRRHKRIFHAVSQLSIYEAQ